jgi:membrane protease YdiL (CAAX protease family)
MEYSPMPVEIPRKSWIDRVQALFEVLLLSGLISSFLAAIPIAGFYHKDAQSLLKDARTVSLYLLLESAITFLILAFLMKVHRESIGSLGLRWEHWRRNALIGLAVVPFLFMINGVVALIFKIYLPKYFLEQNPLTQIIHTPEQLALFILSALVAGGIKEELQRAFIINRFRSLLGGAVVGLVLWSLAFGAGHYIQGAQGIVIASMYGFFFGVIYLLSGSLVAPIVAHAAYDTLALLASWYFRK